MSKYVDFVSNEPGRDPLTIVDAYTTTGYFLPKGTEWGTHTPLEVWASNIDSYAQQRVGGGYQSRNMTLPLFVDAEGVQSSTTVATNLSALHAQLASMDRYGGKIRYRPENISKIVEFEVDAARLEGDLWGPGGEIGSHLQVQCVFTVKPACGLSMDVDDLFDVDTLDTAGLYNLGGSDWTFDVGSTSITAISGGALYGPTGSATTQYIIHSGTGHAYTDCEGIIRAVPGSTISGSRFGVILKRVDASNHLRVRVVDDGSSQLRIDKYVSGSGTNLASTAISSRISNGTPFWVIARVEGRMVHGEYWSTAPSPLGTPTHTVSWQLSAADAALFGETISGQPGIIVAWASSNAQITEYHHRPFAYKGYDQSGINSPDVITLHGGVPGDIPARCTLKIGDEDSLTWGLFAWMPKPKPFNMLVNGDVQFAATNGNFSASAVSGVSAAATSVARVTSSGTYPYGNALEIVCPATTNTGTNYAIHRRFKAGVTYTVSMYAWASAATTTVQCKLGVSGDIASSTATALSTTWTKHTTTWTPTADVDTAYFAAVITAATATTWRIGKCMVYEGTTEPDHYIGGHVPWGVFGAGNAINRSASWSTSGIGLSWTGVFAGETLKYYMPAWPVCPDDHSGGTYMFKVFARMSVQSTAVELQVVADVDGEYSIEHGSTGVAVDSPTTTTKYRNVFLGTFAINNPPDRFDRNLLTLSFATNPSSSGSAVTIVDRLVIVPFTRHASYPTGLALADAPQYPTSALGVFEFDKTAHGETWPFRDSSVSAFPSLGGANIMLPPGDTELLVWTADYIPNLTDANNDYSASVDLDTYVQASITPGLVSMRP